MRFSHQQKVLLWTPATVPYEAKSVSTITHQINRPGEKLTNKQTKGKQKRINLWGTKASAVHLGCQKGRKNYLFWISLCQLPGGYPGRHSDERFWRNRELVLPDKH